MARRERSASCLLFYQPPPPPPPDDPPLELPPPSLLEPGAAIPAAIPAAAAAHIPVAPAPPDNPPPPAYPGTKKRYGTTGNSFLAAVEFGPQIKAKTITAGGESGDPKNLHFDDQAVRYAAGDLCDVYFYKAQLKGHIERQYHPGSVRAMKRIARHPGFFRVLGLLTKPLLW